MSEINATVQEEIDLIVKAARGERFHFIVVAYDHLSLIDRVKEALIEKYPERRMTTLKVGAEPETDFIQSILEAPVGLVFIDDFELLLKNEALALGFNQKRDLITKLAIALVCFVPFDRMLLRECPRKIPDMWSVRSLLAELKGYALIKSLEFTQSDLSNNPYKNYSLQEKEEEIKALRKRIASISEDTDSEGLVAQMHQHLGELYYARGMYEEAIAATQAALLIFEREEDRKRKGQLINTLGVLELTKANYEEALSYFERGLAIQQQIGDHSGVASTLNNISQIYVAKGDYNMALHYLEQSLDISAPYDKGAALNNISQIYSDKRDYDMALRYLEQSLAISKQIGDRSGEGSALNNISQIFTAKGDYEMALRYLENSLAISQQIGDRYIKGSTLSKIGQIYAYKGDYDIALRYLEQSLDIQQQIGDRYGLCSTLHNMATLYLNQKNDFQKFLKLEILAYQTAVEIGDVEAIYRVGKYLGDVLCKYGMIEHGLPILQNVHQIGIQAGFPDVEKVGDLIKKYSNGVTS